MDDSFECWVPVPKTEWRFAVSNRGRCMKLAKKRRLGRKTFLMAVNEPVALVADYKTGELGWYCFFDGESRFFGREALMSLFPEELRHADLSRDAEAVARRNATLRNFGTEDKSRPPMGKTVD